MVVVGGGLATVYSRRGGQRTLDGRYDNLHWIGQRGGGGGGRGRGRVVEQLDGKLVMGLCLKFQGSCGTRILCILHMLARG